MKKQHLSEKVKQILNTHLENKPIIDGFEFLCEVFEMHPSAEIKIGCGISVIDIRRNQFNTKGFWIRRKDGSETDISYLQCFKGKPTKRSYVVTACRKAVEPIVKQVRDAALNTRCPITGEWLESGNIHIDHYDLTFAELFAEWIKDKSIDELYSKINDTSVDGETDVYFTDQDIVSEFVYYHDGKTHLRAVSKHANLVILRQKTLNEYFKK